MHRDGPLSNIYFQGLAKTVAIAFEKLIVYQKAIALFGWRSTHFIPNCFVRIYLLFSWMGATLNSVVRFVVSLTG